jgi:hypothetical protein
MSSHVLRHSIMSLGFLTISTLAFGAQSHAYFINLGLGAGVSVQSSHTQVTTVGTNLNNRYVSDAQSRFSYLISLGAGLRHAINSDTTMALSLDLYRINFKNTTGVVNPGYNVNPAYDPLNYSVHINPTYAAMAQVRFTWHKDLPPIKVNPYLLVGVGIAYNSAKNYTETTPASGTGLPTLNPYKNGNNLSPAFTVGVGISHTFAHEGTLNLGYQYIYAGHAKLKPFTDQPNNRRFESPALQGHYLILNYAFAL